MHTLNKLRSVGALILTTLSLAGAAAIGDDTDQFTPLCRDTAGYRDGVVTHHCWTPVANHPGCHFHGLLSFFDNTAAVSWSGACENDRAVGAGVLTDEAGNRAEGGFVEGRKHGPWTRELANGWTFDETHEEGEWNGPWTLTDAAGVRHAGTYVDNARRGKWSRVWPDGYSEVGPVENRKRHGAWTITWPNGYEAVVAYVEGTIHGDVTVTHRGAPLGVLVYREGERIGPGLPPVFPPPLPPPPDP
ncbi:MAG: hypothetical protein OXI95_05180 [bacterium]|nr:hypothetical protein [bacterium]